MPIRRGDVFWLDFGSGSSPEPGVQSGRRPAVVVQADRENRTSIVSIVVAATHTVKGRAYPCDVIITDARSCLGKDARIMCNQIHTIPQHYLVPQDCIGRLDAGIMSQVDAALKNILGLP